MRMLSKDEARELLQKARIGRLGCIVNEVPYVIPINCYLEGDYVYSHSLPGLKIAALRDNPNACIQVDEVESELSWSSVIAFGKYEELKRPHERSEILTRLLHRFPLLTPVESAIASDGFSQEIIVFRIKIERLTGVSEG